LANGHFYTGGFAEGVFEGTGRLVKPKVWEYRGSFRAGEMHGIGVFHRRSFGLYSPTLLALTMKDGRPDHTGERRGRVLLNNIREGFGV
jgi:hypothetical protein